MESSPWKTPFGRLLIGSSVVAAIVGFAVATGMTTYFRTAAAEPDNIAETLDTGPAVNLYEGAADPSLQAQDDTSQQDDQSMTQTPPQDQYYAGSDAPPQESSSADSIEGDQPSGNSYADDAATTDQESDNQ